MKNDTNNLINIFLLVLLVGVIIYGTYDTYMRYKQPQSITFWVIEVFHHFITAFLVLGIFVQNQTFYFTLTHLLITAFTLIHWYVNEYVFDNRKCILTIYSNISIKHNPQYKYNNPFKKMLFINQDTRQANHHTTNKLSGNFDTFFLLALIIYDVFALTPKRFFL